MKKLTSEEHYILKKLKDYDKHVICADFYDDIKFSVSKTDRILKSLLYKGYIEGNSNVIYITDSGYSVI